MIRCLIIDDEPLALDLLEDNLRQVDYIQVTGKARNAADALRILRDNPVDLIFCDIQMPGISGLQMVSSMTVRPMIIFVTAYEHFALQGFDLEVLDYLIKPVPMDRFLRACQKAYRVMETRQAAQILPAAQSRNYLFVYSDYNLIKINLDKIEFAEGLKDYVKIHLTGADKPLLTRMSIKTLEAQLPAERFYRVHKSYIINVDYVQHIRRGKIKTLTSELPLSDAYRDMIDRMTGKALA
ncbi:LytTR family DNA-binding domain-containing protein [Mucilaginibacter sp. SG564]|uniref:LytR/AlgR family response regulator transcription factor n=1 Tax=unclassified Mucilaginibacter TaxID=2617802 RepID=UPI001C12B0ED|nr:LytTR family DNA-binding domain-containing protein [Mucilaginibacter sp. SG564]NOW93820.1 DNA-binding LytR/AlgR family response regulator [Mucilaginibacter sp. SG564]